MFFVALATDYDGTLARNGHVEASVRSAIEELRRSGRKLLLVTGRDLGDLKDAFGPLDVFDMVVAENGALLFDPARREETLLGEPPPPVLVDRLRQLGVKPLSVGHAIIATWEPNEAIVLEAIRELSLEYNIIFNKGAVMVLPSGINKASGLKAALKRLRLSPQNVVGIGDAENDQAFLGACGCAVAVANAVPALRDKADFVVADHGAGVIELVQMLACDLASVEPPVPRTRPSIGEMPDDSCYRLSRFDKILVTGSSGSGKSTTVTALLEQLRELGYQFCVVDPEGDYEELADAVVVGDAKQVPRITQATELLANPETNVVINLLAIDSIERPPFVGKLLPSLTELRLETGRPHWIILDEAHYCLPANWHPAPVTLPQELSAVVAVTVHPEEVAPEFLAMMSTVLAVGEGAQDAIGRFCQSVGQKIPEMPKLAARQALLFDRASGDVQVINPAEPREKHKRHLRKYAEGELGEDKSFYFRGPQGALNLRAYNLASFLQLAAGVDDATWLHHLREGAYSRWFRDMIKDDELARQAAEIGDDRTLSAADSRARIKELIESRYTALVK
jgi:hydroxymethylpyrimidine pyrophosphatase-like HAD family hydrolase